MSPFSLQIWKTKPLIVCGAFLTLLFCGGQLQAGLGNDDGWANGSLPAAPPSPPSEAAP